MILAPAMDCNDAYWFHSIKHHVDLTHLCPASIYRTLQKYLLPKYQRTLYQR